MTGFLTIAQAAERLDVSRQTIHNMIADGRLTAIWLIEKWAVPQSEVARAKRAKAKKYRKAA